MKIAGITLPEVVSDALRACRPHFVAAATFSFLINLLYLAPAIYMLQVYDRVLATGGTTTLVFITIALSIALLTLAGLDTFRNRLLVRASVRLDSILSPIILRRGLWSGTRDSVQAMRDFDNVRQALGSPAVGALFDLPWAPIFILVAFMLHFWLGILAILSAALLLFLAWRNQKATRPAIETATRSLAASHASEQATAANAGTLRGLGMVGAMLRRQLHQRSGGIGQLAEAQFSGSRFTATSRFVRLFVQSAALGLGALLAIAGDISSGGIIAASILLGRALQPIDSLVGSWSTLMSARAALSRLSEALNQPIELDRERTLLPPPEGRVDVENVTVLAEDRRPIIHGVTFATQPGEILGIIGPSGSGKTTLAKTIAGAIIPQAGVVRIDGAQRGDWDLDQLGRYVGYLPQDPSLFEGTVKENISRFQSPDEPGIDEAVITAAKLAGVHDLILKLPQGYDTRLGPMGAGVSAGQGQRIALARALYRDPTILILDEPNSFLDAEGEAALLRALVAARSRGATVLLIAHRKTVLDVVDRLLLLEGGKPKMLGPAKDVVVRLARPGSESAA